MASEGRVVAYDGKEKRGLTYDHDPCSHEVGTVGCKPFEEFAIEEGAGSRVRRTENDRGKQRRGSKDFTLKMEDEET